MNAQTVGPGGRGRGHVPPAGLPLRPNLMFVACDMLAIYRITDGGTSWTMCDTRQVHGSEDDSVGKISKEAHPRRRF
jgi:hypothetical protein